VNTAIHDPAAYAALALKLALERHGVRVAGSAIALHVPPRDFKAAPVADGSVAAAIGGSVAETPVKADYGTACIGSAMISVLATHPSVALGDDLSYTVKASDNLHAEILLKNVGAAFGCAHTEAWSLAVMRAYLKQVGIAAGDVVLYDGSGLSGHDLVAPRALTQMLVYAAKQKWGASYKAALPVGGVDGTLTNRFLPPGSTLQGKVFAKTGTLGESRALSGYVTAASGATVVFSVMVDNHRPGDPADRAAMDKMVEAIAAGN
jgi:D-alanyl-D-alanine carboxypeptidase/D-alanyl-D-alanine-endopeptidase (penicillin-binding protein 4)